MWTYQLNKISSIKDVPKDAYGFIYLITILNKEHESLYIGKKILYNTIKRKMGKKDIALWRSQNSRGRVPKHKIVKKESDWLEYKGSHPVLLEYKGPIEKEIWCFAKSKKELTYLEEHYQHINNVLENPLFLNENIGGKFFRNKLR